MATPLGGHHLEPSASIDGTSRASNNGNSIPDSYSGVLKHNPGISSEWTAEEQSVLDDGLAKFASESKINRYAKIAIQLQNKTVRDVALRCRWMTKKENGKRRKEENLSKKNRDRKEKGNEPFPRQMPFVSASSMSSYPNSLFPWNLEDGSSYNGIGGMNGELLEQNALAFNRISCNLSAMHAQENIDLLRQTRDNIMRIMSNLNEAPEIMKQMPPLPVRLNEELALTILPPTM